MYIQILMYICVSLWSKTTLFMSVRMHSPAISISNGDCVFACVGGGRSEPVQICGMTQMTCVWDMV